MTDKKFGKVVGIEPVRLQKPPHEQHTIARYDIEEGFEVNSIDVPAEQDCIHFIVLKYSPSLCVQSLLKVREQIHDHVGKSMYISIIENIAIGDTQLFYVDAEVIVDHLTSQLNFGIWYPSADEITESVDTLEIGIPYTGTVVGENVSMRLGDEELKLHIQDQNVGINNESLSLSVDMDWKPEGDLYIQGNKVGKNFGVSVGAKVGNKIFITQFLEMISNKHLGFFNTNEEFTGSAVKHAMVWYRHDPRVNQEIDKDHFKKLCHNYFSHWYDLFWTERTLDSYPFGGLDEGC